MSRRLLGRCRHVLAATEVRSLGITSVHGLRIAPAINVATQAEAPQPLLDALQHITDTPDIGLAELVRLADVLPDASHNLAPWAAHLTQLITEHSPTPAPTTSPTSPQA